MELPVLSRNQQIIQWEIEYEQLSYAVSRAAHDGYAKPCPNLMVRKTSFVPRRDGNVS
jgi:hypothetical protein